jgi:cell division protein FtsB
MKRFFNFILIFFLTLLSIYFLILISKKYNIKRNNLKYYLKVQKDIKNEKEIFAKLENEEKELEKKISQEKINRNLLWKKKPGEVVIKINEEEEINFELKEETIELRKKPSEAWLEIFE